MPSKERELRLTHNALNDFQGIRSYTEDTYGAKQHDSYSHLIDQALEDIRVDPYRPGSKSRPEISPKTRSYQIALSKERAGGEVKKPRHVIFYFDDRGEALVVTRILHDAQDFKRHLSQSDIDRERE